AIPESAASVLAVLACLNRIFVRATARSQDHPTRRLRGLPQPNPALSCFSPHPHPSFPSDPDPMPGSRQTIMRTSLARQPFSRSFSPRPANSVARRIRDPQRGWCRTRERTTCPIVQDTFVPPALRLVSRGRGGALPLWPVGSET